MWETTVTVHGAATPPEIWAALVSPPAWPRWNDGVGWVALEGALAPGSYATVKPVRGRQTAFRLEAVVPERELLAALTVGPAAVLRVCWRIEACREGSALALTIAAGGPLGGLLQARARRLAAAMVPRLERLAAPEQSRPGKGERATP